ncbi:hypothetical protein J6590_025919 [Homalodisca vitripennis]|nr:hypothetical protein J6590_025919 [Homalodisca vitripennis]
MSHCSRTGLYDIQKRASSGRKMQNMPSYNSKSPRAIYRLVLSLLSAIELLMPSSANQRTSLCNGRLFVLTYTLSTVQGVW